MIVKDIRKQLKKSGSKLYIWANYSYDDGMQVQANKASFLSQLESFNDSEELRASKVDGNIYLG